MAQISFGFPNLEVKDIISYLRSEIQSDMDVSEADFKSPQKERWQKFYMLMLCDCCLDLSPESLNLMPVDSFFEYPELHDESVPLLNVFKCMQAVLTTCGVVDFKISDILFPTGKRLIKILSALINFRRFQEERLQVYKDMQGENEALQDQRDALLKEIEELQQRINRYKGSRAEKEPEIQMIKDETSQDDQIMESMHQSTAVLQREVKEHQTAVAEKKLTAASLKEQITSLKLENNSLDAQIVPSPDRLKGEMQRMEQQVKQLKMSKEESLMMRLEHKGRRQLQEKREQEGDQASKLILAVKEQTDKQRSGQILLNDQKEEAVNKQDDIKSLDARKQQVNLRLLILQENLEKCTLLFNNKITEMKASHDLLKSERENRLKSTNAEERSKHNLLEEKLKEQQEQAREMKRHIDNVDKLKTLYSELLCKLDDYHNRLASSCLKVRKTST